MVRPIDQETIASEETGCYFHRSQRQGHCQAMQEYMEKHQGQSGGREEEETWTQESLLCFMEITDV